VKKILVDTNFLLMQFEDGIDIRANLQRIVHGPIVLVLASGTQEELRALAGRNGRRAMAARFVLQNFAKLTGGFVVEIAASKGPVDEWIIKYAQENDVTVATNDIPLRSRLRRLGVPLIASKSRAKLDFV
jgi:rRNA-processing protein FCF1